MTTPENIRANAHYHTELLRQISELDYVPAALEQQDGFVRDLEMQIQSGTRKLKQLEEKTKKEKKEHEAIRDSTAKRLAHKLTGRREKYEAKASKEEREYVEAVEYELTERESLEAIKQLLADAKQEQSNLSVKKKQHDTLKQQLNALYSEVFDGPSESYPEDDRMEYDLHEAEKRHDNVQRTLNQESQAAELLATAEQSMSRCQAKVSEALSYSTWDMWGGGTLTDLMEREALRMASSYAYQAQNTVNQARNIHPHIEPLRNVNIAQGSILSDVFFDNIFTDMAFHKKIEASVREVTIALNHLKLQRAGCLRRVDAAGTELLNLARELDARREELTGYRHAAFESMAATLEPLPATAPPTYDAVLDQPPTSAPAQEPSVSSPSSPTSSVTYDPPSSPPPHLLQNPQMYSPEPMQSTTSLPTSPPAPPHWGNRNPYAAAMAIRTRSISQEH